MEEMKKFRQEKPCCGGQMISRKEVAVYPTKLHQRTHTVDPDFILNCVAEDPKQSLRRMANKCEVSFVSVRRVLKRNNRKCYE